MPSTQSLRIPGVVQADGRIVVGGQSGGAMTLARFNASGAPDTTWAPSGAVVTPLGASGYATAIVPSASGFAVAGRRADASLGNAYLDVVVTRSTGGP